MAQDFDGPVVVRGLLDVRNEHPSGFSRVGRVKATSFEVPRGFGVFRGGEANVDTVQCGRITVQDDIVLANADCAEEFRAAAACAQKPEPGAVVTLDEEGCLRLSSRAYDRRVVGVVSGGGDYKPGLVLDRRSDDPDRIVVALMGKVACKVDAAQAPVEVGDLLTTSDCPGHAMKALDNSRSFGAVIGKALRPLREGVALVPVLVALQ